MKKILVGILVLAAGASCKKSHDDVISCDVSVAGIAANYKITKVVAYFPSGLPDQDMTTTYLTDCERSGVYQLKSDKSLVYNEDAACSTTGSGNWDVVNGKLSMSGGGQTFSDVPVTGWDCGTLTLSEDFGSGTGYRFSFTKQ